MDIIKKAIELRKSIPLKSKEPFWAFQNRLHNASLIIRIIEKNSKSNSVMYEARRQYIVCLTAAFEIYWRELIKGVIDSHELNQNQIKKIRDINFTIADIKQIVGHKITLGELISSAYIFQEHSKLNKIISELLEIDAFGEFAKTQYSITIDIFNLPSYKKKKNTYTKIIKGSEILSEARHIEKCFTIRHGCVHNTGVRFKVSKKQLMQFQSAMNLFNLAFGFFVEKKFDELCKKKRRL